MPNKPPVYSYSVAVDDTRGLDPDVYNVTLVINREDGEPLTAEERQKIEAAWRVETAKKAAPRPPAPAPKKQRATG